jgi:hypothetical protein
MIRHARPALAVAVLPLAVAVVEPPFGTLLVTAIGRAMLAQARRSAALQAAIALSPITTGAQKKQRATFPGVTEPLSQNHFRLCRHAPYQAALDNGSGFVAG